MYAMPLAEGTGVAVEVDGEEPEVVEEVTVPVPPLD
jgi:hypothetical protein